MSRAPIFALSRADNSANTPGPGAYDTYRRPGEDSPKWTLKGRTTLEHKATDAPYRVLPSTVGEGPKISLASRHEAKGSEDSTPGPFFVPPPLGTEAKKSSLGSRHQSERDPTRDNPGPGTYDVQPSFAKNAKKFTLKSRTPLPGDEETCSPGPGAYYPDYKVTKHRAPSPTLHSRTPISQIDITPGPSDYDVPRKLGGKSPTLHGRPQTAAAFNTPGPGQYDVENTPRRGPKFTLKGRTPKVERPNTAPYRELPSTIGDGPKYSLGIRHKQIEPGDATPGPTYVPPPLGSEAHKSSLGSRHQSERDPTRDNPGPGTYDVQPEFGNESKKFTLKSRTPLSSESSNCSPGPGAYYPDISATRPSSPCSTLHSRPDSSAVSETPGYLDLGSTLNTPRITIGKKDGLDMVQI